MLSTYNTLFRNFKFSSLSRRFFNTSTQPKSPIKSFQISVATQGNKSICKTSTEEIEIKEPLEHVLASAGSCEIHTIRAFAFWNKVPIEDIQVDVKGEYDTDLFRGKKTGINTYSKVDVEFRIKSSETDRKKLEETVNQAIERCPVMNTLHLAGIQINKKINYL
jgi:uncharacterized OsmC-like protein